MSRVKLTEAQVDTDALWEALKRECCSTRPDSPDWAKVGKIVTLRKSQLAAAVRALKENRDGR